MPIRELPSHLSAIVAEEVNETDAKRRDDSISYIKEWLSKQPHITPCTDDQWLVAFLRCCKYSLERTKEKIDSFYSLRSAVPEVFKDRDPLSPELQEVLDLGINFPLPKLDHLGRRVMLMRPGKYPPTMDMLNKVNKLASMGMEIMLMEDDDYTVKGVVSLLDLSDVTLGHMTLMSPTAIKKMTTLFQDGYPLRMKGGHYIHTPPQFEVVYNIFQRFMREKLKNRLYVHGSNMESLYEHLPKEVLPVEYGGSGGRLDDIAKEWKKKVESYREWFIEEEKYGVDEKKRPGKPRLYEDLFGVEGSFRALTVD